MPTYYVTFAPSPSYAEFVMNPIDVTADSPEDAIDQANEIAEQELSEISVGDFGLDVQDAAQADEASYVNRPAVTSLHGPSGELIVYAGGEAVGAVRIARETTLAGSSVPRRTLVFESYDESLSALDGTEREGVPEQAAFAFLEDVRAAVTVSEAG